MTTVHLTGASDDLIELDGDIVEEFTYHDDQAPEDDDDKYTDRATLSGPDVTWAVHGVGWAKTR